MIFWINITFPYINFQSITYNELKEYHPIALKIQSKFNLVFKEKKIKVKGVRNFTLSFTNYENFNLYDPTQLDGSAWETVRYVDVLTLNEQKCISIIMKETEEVLRLLAIKKELPEDFFDECVVAVYQNG